MKKIHTLLIFLALLMSITACYSPKMDKVASIDIPLKQIENNQNSKNEDFSHFTTYKILSGDILDLMFHFESTVSQDYQVMIRDVLEIKFPELPELNQEQRIRPDGMISLPYIGDIKAQGNTPAELRALLIKSYASILKNPELYIIVKESGVKVQEIMESIRNTARGQSKLITIRNDGAATFPLIGEVNVRDKTIPELKHELNIKYTRINKDIRIDLLLHTSAGAKICVLGAVNSPGYYPVNKPVTILEALALAGGLRNDSELSSVITMRRKDNMMVHKAIDIRNILNATPGASHPVIMYNDIVYVSRQKLAQAADVARQIGEVLFFRGVGVGFGYDLNDDD